MFTASYYKIANRWHFDYPAYISNGGNPEDLERVGAMHDLLEMVAEGKSSVKLVLHDEPFEGAEEAILVGSSGDGSGAYYQLHTLKGKAVDLEFWVDEMIYLQHKEPPAKIYGKVVC